MLSLMQAGQILKDNIPECYIHSYVEHKGKYIFEVYVLSPSEMGLDPFYSVDRKTGEFAGYDIIGESPEKRAVKELFIEARKMLNV